MGKAARLAAAKDFGAQAGGEINDFALDMLRRMNASGNLCASPASIAIALAMVRPGAKGVTASEMDAVLRNFGSPAQAAEVVALLKVLAAQTSYADTNRKTPVLQLNVSNAVFSQKGLGLLTPYLNALSSEFGAGVGMVDFKNDAEAARAIINHWASIQTHGRIPEVLQAGDVNDATRIALANAIFLKAGWSHPFDPKLTKSLPFTTAAGPKVSVPTMFIRSRFAYAAGSGYRAVSLPLGAMYGSLSVSIVVPDNMATFIAGLTSAKLAAIHKAASTYDVNLSLPRFSAETRTDLAQMLIAMGMPTAFGNADLSGITGDEQLALGKVIHDANIDVVEEGVTAAAVTVVTGQATAGPGGFPRVTFNVNKPFLYFIREEQSGTILFMGRIDDPSLSR